MITGLALIMMILSLTEGEPQSSLTWRSLFGIHYSIEEPDVGIVRDAPIHQWGDTLDVTDRKPEGVTSFRGPFSGQMRLFDFAGRTLRFSNDAIVAEAGEKGIIVLPILGLPRKLSLYERYEVWQDIVYAQVHRYNAGEFAPHPVRYWQLGNEINGITHFNILGLDLKVVNPWRHFNRPEQLEAYVNRFFAPTAAAVRRASKDIYGDERRLKIVLGSIANAYNPTSRRWLNDLLSRHIDNPRTPELHGKAVWEVADILSFHYLVTRAAPDWEESLDELYRRWIETGRMEGMWATEEHGAKGRGFVTVARVAARWLHWWSKHRWKPDRGRCIFWGVDRPKPGSKGMEAIRLLGEFLDDLPLTEVSEKVKVKGTEGLRLYAFQATHGEAERRLCVVAFPEGEERIIQELSWNDVLFDGEALLIVAHSDRPRSEERIPVRNGRLSFKIPLRLNPATEDTLIVLVKGEL
jgi:hypothetical protein